MNSLGGFKGASTLGVVGLIVQLLVLLFRTPLMAFAAKWKMVIVLTLSVGGSLISLLAQGVDWKVALLSGTVLAFAQGWFHQIWKQFVDKGDEAPAA